MSFDWWHPERTATCFIIVTIVEIHTLNLDVSVCLKERFSFSLSEQLLRNNLNYIEKSVSYSVESL